MRQRIVIVLTLFLFCITPLTQAAPGADSDPVTLRTYDVLYAHIAKISKLGPEWADYLAHSILILGDQFGVHPFLITSLYTQESRFRPDAVSPVGAIGIAQLMPGTAKALGVDPYDPAQNLEGGVRYLAQQLTNFANAGDWSASYAIAAYNAGPDAIRKYGGIPPYEETINHVNRIAEIYQTLVDAYNENL